MSKIPDFGPGMSKAVKEQLTARFKPEFCPNCGRSNQDGHDIKIEELISSVPCWNVSCRMCGASYQLRMYE